MQLEKIGIIDLGSNTARLVIVEMLGDGHFIVIDQLKEAVRIGKDMERDGFLKPQRIAETLKTLKMFRKLCDAYGIEKIIAVATAAVRQAAKIEEFFTEQLKRIEWLKEIDPETRLIGVGGSFRSLCKLSKMVKKSPLNTVHNYRIGIEEFTNLYDMLKVLDLDKKKRIKGISSSRADILPSALAAISSFLKYMGYQEVTISGCGLREGIMFNYAMPITIEKPISDVLTYSLQTLVRFYNCNQKHVEHVVNLSVQLFKQLRVLHKFPRQYLKILKVVAMLHDAGASIKYYDYEKHTAYIILNASIYGLSTREMVMAALVASAHANDDLNMSDIVRYKAYVSEEDVDVIRKLGIMLRIAESLDRSMSSCILSINCDVLGDSVIMKTEVDGDASLEIKDALNAFSDFKRIFHKNLEIL